jgi:RimJ/RimL family protein N-acetyltransferase
MTLKLRALDTGDLETLFAWESEPRAVRMAAFTRADPADRAAFDAHYERVRSDPANTLRAIEDDGEFVGTVCSFTMDGDRDVAYWINPALWGRGVASQALHAFLAIETTRPLYGRVAEHNHGSAKVLSRNGFVQIGIERSFAPGLGVEVVECIYRLAPEPRR